MGQQTLGMNGEAYSLVVLDVGSDLEAVINTRTREDPWQHLDELAALWGHTPKAIRGDGAAEFEHAAGFEAWRRRHETTTTYAAVRNIMPNSNKTWSHSHRTQLLSHIGCASTPSCCCTTLAAWLS